MSEYIVPPEYFFRLHHVRPRFKSDIENVLIYIAEELCKIGERPKTEFASAVNDALLHYPGNAHRTMKTINNWRTEISSLFGFVEHDVTTDKPSRRAIELAEHQDLVECFKIFLYYFQYPGAHIKPHNILEQIQAGIHFKPAQYLLQLLRYANQNSAQAIGLTKSEVCHCIFNDLRVTRDHDGVDKTWNRIATNRLHHCKYDQTSDVIRYAGDILDYMEIANLLKTYDGHAYYLNILEAEAIIKFCNSNEWFSGYDNMLKTHSGSLPVIKSCTAQWFAYVNRDLEQTDFATDILAYINQELPTSTMYMLEEFLGLHNSLGNSLESGIEHNMEGCIVNGIGNSLESGITHNIEGCIANGFGNIWKRSIENSALKQECAELIDHQTLDLLSYKLTELQDRDISQILNTHANDVFSPSTLSIDKLNPFTLFPQGQTQLVQSVPVAAFVSTATDKLNHDPAAQYKTYTLAQHVPASNLVLAKPNPQHPLRPAYSPTTYIMEHSPEQLMQRNQELQRRIAALYDSYSAKDMGDISECLVHGHECMRLKLGGREDLIHLVKRIPAHFALGYDISSVELDERKRYIEVKSTISSKPLHFNRIHLTTNEWNAASSMHERYFIYRLLLSKFELKLFVMQDPVGLYKKDLINMVPNNGADITFDPNKVGKFEVLLTWAN